MFRDVDECGKYHTWKMWKILQIIKFIVLKFFPFSCYFFLPRSKYSSKHRGPISSRNMWDQVSYPYRTTPASCTFESSYSGNKNRLFVSMRVMLRNIHVTRLSNWQCPIKYTEGSSFPSNLSSVYTIWLGQLRPAFILRTGQEKWTRFYGVRVMAYKRDVPLLRCCNAFLTVIVRLDVNRLNTAVPRYCNPESFANSLYAVGRCVLSGL